MLDLYTWKTSNGRKVTVMAEELGVPYRLHKVDIGNGEQFTEAFTAINPNQKIPALVDSEGPGGTPYTLIESGAILMYLAEKHERFLPRETAARYTVVQWLMFQMGGVGPMFGQAHHFRQAAREQVPYAIERYTRETRRLWGVLDRRLEAHEYLAGDYSIADIATFPWSARHAWQGIALDEFPNVARWYRSIAARPAVARGMDAVFE